MRAAFLVVVCILGGLGTALFGSTDSDAPPYDELSLRDSFRADPRSMETQTSSEGPSPLGFVSTIAWLLAPLVFLGKRADGVAREWQSSNRARSARPTRP
jgi:hypothetical protein